MRSCRCCTHASPPSFPTRRSSDLKVSTVTAVWGRGDNRRPQSFPRLSCHARCPKSPDCFRIRTTRGGDGGQDRKSTRLNSSHANISYAVFCLTKKILPLLYSRIFC